MAQHRKPTIVASDYEPVITGVYFLFREHELIYIGRSDNVYKRLADHRAGGRTFDYALVTACSKLDSQWIERALHKATGHKSSPVRDSGVAIDHGRSIPPLPLPLPQPQPTWPPIVSAAQGYKYLSETGYPVISGYREAVKTGKIPSVQAGRYQHVMIADIEAWALTELTRLGFDVAKLKNGAAVL